MLIQCPYKDCTHTGVTLTNLHCQSRHNMSRDQVIAKYGKPIQLREDRVKLKQNHSMNREQWTSGIQSVPKSIRWRDAR